MPYRFPRFEIILCEVGLRRLCHIPAASRPKIAGKRSRLVYSLSAIGIIVPSVHVILNLDNSRAANSGQIAI